MGAGELPPAVQAFVANLGDYIPKIDEGAVTVEKFAAANQAAAAKVDESLTAVSASTDAAAASQDKLMESYLAMADMSKVAEAANNTLSESYLAMVDMTRVAEAAQKQLAEAEKVAGDVAVTTAAKTEAAAAKTDEAAASGTAFGSKMSKAFLGVAAGATYAVVKASGFEAEVTKLYTAAGLTGQAMGGVEQKLLAIGTATGYSGTQIAEAMYHATSAGLDFKTSLLAVDQAAKLSQIHGANLDDTMYGLSSTMKAYNLGASQVTHTSALLNAIVGQGDMRFQDYNQSIKNWAPTGAAMGISIQSMGAAIAYLTDRGNSAEVASTRLTMGLSMVTAGSKAANTYLKDLGLTTGSLDLRNKSLQKTMEAGGLTTNKFAADLRKPDGITVALKDLQASFRKAGLSADQADQVMAKLFGGGRSDKAIMSLMQNLGGVEQKYNSIGKAVGNYGASWQKTQATTAQQWKETEAGLKNLATEFGLVLLPAVNKVLSPINRVFQALEKSPQATKLIGVLAVALGAAALAVKVMTVATAAFDVVMDANPVMLVVLALIALGIGLYEAYKHSKTFRDIVNAVGNALKAGFEAALHAAGAVIKWFTDGPLKWIQEQIKVFTDWYTAHSEEISQVTGAVWKVISAYFTIYWDIIWAVIKDGLTMLEGTWKLVWGLVSDYFKLVWSTMAAVVHAALKVILDYIGIALDLVTGHWSKAWNDLKKLTSDALNGAINIIKTISSGFGTLLVDAGKNIVQGLINGIESMASNLGNAVSGIASTVANFFPHSPAKEGPLSGAGDPYLSGGQIAKRLAQGMADNTAVVKTATDALAGGAVINATAGGWRPTTGTAPKPGSIAAQEARLLKLYAAAEKKDARYDGEVDKWEKEEAKYRREYDKTHNKRYLTAEKRAEAEVRKYDKLDAEQDRLAKLYHSQYEKLAHPPAPLTLSKRELGRREYSAAMAAESSLNDMRSGPLAAWGDSGYGAGQGSGGSTVNQHVTVEVHLHGTVGSITNRQAKQIADAVRPKLAGRALVNRTNGTSNPRALP